jgi:hypothetical protein
LPPPDIAARGFARPVGNGSGAPTLPSGAAAPLSSVQIFPPWLYTPDSGLDFNPRADGVVSAPGTTVRPAGLVFNLQPGYAGVVRFVAIFIDAPTTLLDIQFILTVNNGPVPGWDNLRSFPRNANNISITTEGVVQLPQNAQLGITIVNQGVGAFTVGASYGGWQWPVAWEYATFGRRVSKG